MLLSILLLGWLLKRFQQRYVVAYNIAGILLGLSKMGVNLNQITDKSIKVKFLKNIYSLRFK